MKVKIPKNTTVKALMVERRATFEQDIAPYLETLNWDSDTHTDFEHVDVNKKWKVKGFFYANLFMMYAKYAKYRLILLYNVGKYKHIVFA